MKPIPSMFQARKTEKKLRLEAWELLAKPSNPSIYMLTAKLQQNSFNFLLFFLLFNSSCSKTAENKTTITKMKKIIQTPNAPAPIGPYSQAVQIDNTLYLSGQVAINPLTNQLNNPDLETETKQVMDNIKAIITEAGFEMKDIVKTSIFLSDMVYFQRVNQVYATYFNSDFPARETVQVAGLPLKVNVEISVIAVMQNQEL
jgi:2-iminobutanoate/2-iminopropanoate deaminase